MTDTLNYRVNDTVYNITLRELGVVSKVRKDSSGGAIVDITLGYNHIHTCRPSELALYKREEEPLTAWDVDTVTSVLDEFVNDEYDPTEDETEYNAIMALIQKIKNLGS